MWQVWFKAVAICYNFVIENRRDQIYQNAIQRGRSLKQQSHDIQQGGGSLADELDKLAKLKEQDIISAEEFQQMKNDLLSKM